MLLINGIYYNPAFITHIQKEVSLTNSILSEQEAPEWLCIYFSVPVKNSKQCTLMIRDSSCGEDYKDKVWLMPHLFPDKEDAVDVWLLKVDDAKDIKRVEKCLKISLSLMASC